VNEKVMALGVENSQTMPGSSIMEQNTAVDISTQKQHLSGIEAGIGDSRQVGSQAVGTGNTGFDDSLMTSKIEGRNEMIGAILSSPGAERTTSQVHAQLLESTVREEDAASGQDADAEPPAKIHITNQDHSASPSHMDRERTSITTADMQQEKTAAQS
jgi:hypothetical protein